MISAELKNHAVMQLEKGASLRQVASPWISKSALQDAKKAKAQSGYIPLARKSTGRPSKVPLLVQQFIVVTIQQRPTIYQDELRDMIQHFYGLSISQPTISRFLHKLGFSYKKVSSVALQQDEQLRLEYALFIGQFRPDQLIFADESHFNNRTGHRTCGWARRGDRAEDWRLLVRGTRYSLLPALAQDAILAPWVIDGSVDTERFNYWVKHHLLPVTNPFPASRSVIVIDNCSTHKSPALREIIEGAGRILIFLPAYSPDYSPIEWAFGIIKRHLKRHPPNHPYDIINATYTAVTPDHARAFFKAAGYGINE